MADGTAQNGTNTVSTDEVTTENGVTVAARHAQRVKVDSKGSDGAFTDTSSAAPFPIFPQNSGRVMVTYAATGVAAGATGTETLISLIRMTADGAAAGAAAGSQTLSSGKRFRATSITFAARGNATATAQVTTFSLRFNPTGATTTASNAALPARVATPATALAWDRAQFFFDEMGMDFPLGDGTKTFGVSANAVYTTNAPTWDVVITGYEYTP